MNPNPLAGYVWNGKERTILLLERPEHGGWKIRDVATLDDPELRWVKNELRRITLALLRRQGLIRGGGKGSGKRTVRVRPEAT